MEFLLHSGQIEPCAQLYLVSCHLLGIVADNTTAMDLRVEASKCIGQIGSVTFGELLNIDFTPCCASDWLVLTDSCRPLLMTFATTKVLEILVDHIKEQPQSESAQAALKAFQEVASTRQGSAAIGRMDVGNFKKFILMERPPHVHKFTPSPDFVTNAFMLSNRDNDMHQDSIMWCWSERLWEFGHGSYGDWIKRLVTSLIICCYESDNTKCGVRGGNHSIRAFARVSSLSSSIATYIFPMVILDLLLSDKHARTKNPHTIKTAKESWVGNPYSLAAQNVSRCVGWLSGSLQKCSDAEFS